MVSYYRGMGRVNLEFISEYKAVPVLGNASKLYVGNQNQAAFYAESRGVEELIWRLMEEFDLPNKIGINPVDLGMQLLGIAFDSYGRFGFYGTAHQLGSLFGIGRGKISNLMQQKSQGYIVKLGIPDELSIDSTFESHDYYGGLTIPLRNEDGSLNENAKNVIVKQFIRRTHDLYNFTSREYLCFQRFESIREELVFPASSYIEPPVQRVTNPAESYRTKQRRKKRRLAKLQNRG